MLIESFQYQNELNPVLSFFLLSWPFEPELLCLMCFHSLWKLSAYEKKSLYFLFVPFSIWKKLQSVPVAFFET